MALPTPYRGLSDGTSPYGFPYCGNLRPETPTIDRVIKSRKTFQINGERGSYDPKDLGGFGANAKENENRFRAEHSELNEYKAKEWESERKSGVRAIPSEKDKNIEQMEQMSQFFYNLRYTPEKSPNFDDAFGYAQKWVSSEDPQKKGFLTLEDLTGPLPESRDPIPFPKDMPQETKEKILKEMRTRNEENAKRIFGVLDTDGNKKVTPDEVAAYLLFRDDPKSPTLKTLREMEKESGKPLEAKRQELKLSAEKLDSLLDGEVSVSERDFAGRVLFTDPEVVSRSLKDLSTTKFPSHGNKTLPELYEQFAKKQLVPMADKSTAERFSRFKPAEIPLEPKK